MPEIKLHESWKEILIDEFSKPYFVDLKKKLVEEKKSGKIVFPPSTQLFSALDTTHFDKVKVVLIGQDPYHGEGQANGLCFSVNDGIAHPPSLMNIFKELQTDIAGFKTPVTGNLKKWAHEGVLLLNSTLTVRSNNANSHANFGWQNFTDKIIEIVSQNKKNIVFLLWGAYAQSKSKLINSSKHLILNSVHPSPLSAYRGFLGCKHFSKTNEYLVSNGLKPIDWKL